MPSLISSISNTLGFLKEQDPEYLFFSPPLSLNNSVLSDNTHFLVKEKKISTSGEDYDIYQDDDTPFMKVRGTIKSHIPGIDEMSISCFTHDGGGTKKVARLERIKEGIMLYRDTDRLFDSSKLCLIAQDKDTGLFHIYKDESKRDSLYYFEGEFIGRDILMKNNKKETVAKIDERTFTEAKLMDAAATMGGLDSMNLNQVESYDVKIAKGMDAVFVLSCVCAIDEEFDEARMKKDAN